MLRDSADWKINLLFRVQGLKIQGEQKLAPREMLLMRISVETPCQCFIDCVTLILILQQCNVSCLIHNLEELESVTFKLSKHEEAFLKADIMTCHD